MTDRRTLHEEAHGAGGDGAVEMPEDTRPRRSSQRRAFHEAAHKLGYWGPSASAHDEQPETEAARRRFAELAAYHRDVIAQAGRAVLALGALGVVYGDIGTSQLYTEQAIFTNYHATAHVSPEAVF